MEILKVSTKSNPNSVAGALANLLKENDRVEVDTIGAGDCHAGPVLAGLKLGWPLVEAVDLANAMAARVVARSSARLDETEFDAVLNTWRKNAGKDLPAEGKCGIL